MIELIQACSPQMQVEVAQAIIKTESGFNQFAIGVNKGGKAVKQPKDYQSAVNTAQTLIRNGANIDMGFAQINSANLAWLGLTVEQVFQPCNNLKAMQTVYLHCYARAGNTGLGTKMQRALSCYNTGNMTKGFKNGYVNKVTTNFNAFIAGSHQSIKYNQYPQYTQKVEYIPLPQHQNIQQNLSSPSMVKKTEKKENLADTNKHENTVSEPNNEPVKVFHVWDVFKDF